jgi:DNA repair protein RadC
MQMHSTTRSSLGATRLSKLLPDREAAKSEAPGAEVLGLAGADLSSQWDVIQYKLRGRDYSSEFMTRMHHPFGEVLGALFLDAEHKALRYNNYFRGDHPSALSHLPGIARAARELGAVQVILAYNMIFDPNATLPDVRRMHARMHEAGVDLIDFLLISPGHQARSLLVPTLL